MSDSPEVLLRRARALLAEGFLSEAHTCLNELCAFKEELAGIGPPLASAESYGVADNFRQLFQDRIDLVNAHLGGEAKEPAI